MTTINKYSSVPLYFQLKTMIQENIESGKYAADLKIPSEQDLCDEFDISRPTVRQAISDLTSSGHLYKLKGKGTFVSKQKSLISIKDYSGFTDSVLDSKNPSANQFITMEKASNRTFPKLNEVFSIRPEATVDFACVVWVGMHGEEIISLNESWIPLALFPDILEDLGNRKSSQEILKGKYPLLPYHSHSVMDIIHTNPTEASNLHVQPGQPLIRIMNTLSARDGKPVELVVTKYRADKCKLVFETHR
jgi:DNA-binding GntR family transcriptional regulator